MSISIDYNILILSAGTRNKIVQYFKKALTAADGSRSGNVIAADMSALAPALYEADRYYIVSRITEPGYIESVLEICRKEQIRGVLSLIDPELSLLAENADRFQKQGVTVIGSPYEICERCLDKWQMYLWLKEHGYACARSYITLETFFDDMAKGEISFPVFVKPVRGSASIAISKVSDQETLQLLFRHAETPLIIQEFLEGQEIGADCYIDLLSGETVSFFTKKKLLMRAGETDKAVSFQDEKLFDLIRQFIRDFGFRGPIDIDIFDVDGTYYISEVNPRFGGGYPHAYECGADHMGMILKNLRGERNEAGIGRYEEGIYMMKYNEVGIKKERK